MVAERKLRFGVIGAGEFAQVGHVPGLQSHPRAEVVALCGRRYDHVRAMADRLRVPDVHTDYRELCARDDVDGVTIASPDPLHALHAMDVLRHKKHVFCEKPLATNVADAEEMVRVAEDSGKVHQVAFTFRYAYSVRELRRRILQGQLGKPYYLRIQYDGWDGLRPDWQTSWRDKRNMAGGGVLYELGSHLFDLARFILGPIESITGFVHNVPRRQLGNCGAVPLVVETDDMAAAWFRYENGIRGQWFISRVTPRYTENGYVEVIGPEAALRASLSRGKVDVLKLSRPQSPEWEELPLPLEARDEKPHCLGMMMRSFVEACLRGKLDSLDASFHDGLLTQQALAAVAEANEHFTWVRLKNA